MLLLVHNRNIPVHVTGFSSRDAFYFVTYKKVCVLPSIKLFNVCRKNQFYFGELLLIIVDISYAYL